MIYLAMIAGAAVLFVVDLFRTAVGLDEIVRRDEEDAKLDSIYDVCKEEENV